MVYEVEMKALILNSGMGTRMGVLASEQPKCMTEVAPNETIISRQLIQLVNKGIDDVVITTGRFESCLVSYCNSLDLPIHIKYVFNPEYASTNYIYSIYCAREFLEDDILMMHGDLVFENDVLDSVVDSPINSTRYQKFVNSTRGKCHLVSCGGLNIERKMPRENIYDSSVRVFF